MKDFAPLIIILTALGLSLIAPLTQAPPAEIQSAQKLPEVKLPRIRALRMHLEAIRNFTYREDAPGGDVWDVFDISKPFVGDCEDFAFSMQRAVGAGSVYLVLTKDADPDVLADHAVFVFGGVVWDMEDSYTIRGYEALGHRILFRVGDATPEIK